MMIDCLRAYDSIIGEFDRHNAHNPNFAARLLPGCHSAYQLFASCRADCLEMEPRLGVPNPFPPPPLQQPPPSTNPNVVTITCADLDYNSPAMQARRRMHPSPPLVVIPQPDSLPPPPVAFPQPELPPSP